MAKRIKKSDSDWRETLTVDQYAVLRQKGTERAFSGKYWNTKTQGTYHCAGCGKALYSSQDKYDSGSGWPSFTQAVTADAIAAESDMSHGMVRTELLCSSCGGHLGHLFPDGPAPTGRRHCINSLSLELKPTGDLRRLRVLVVDDTDVNCQVFCDMLQHLGHSAKPVHSGAAALAARCDEEFDMIFMDLHMPEMDGVETAARWRKAEDPNRRTKIVAVTADVRAEVQRRFEEVGMDGFLKKPFDLEELRRFLKETYAP